jgi:hypothetical protein
MALMMILGIAVVGWIVMQLWNCLLPSLFMGVQQIGYFQALGVLLLSKILFGSCRSNGRCCVWHQPRENMTAEESDQIKSHFKSRLSHWCSSDKSESGKVSNVE